MRGMMKRLDEVLENKGGNYILPFLWMKGEGKEAIEVEIERIRECGIREICVESRPHPDFMGPVWWEEMDLIMDLAKKNQMKVWLLDDSKFPVGYANGAFKEKPELAKVYLAERHMDVIGPAKDSAVLIEPFLGSDGKLMAVLACKKTDTETLNIDGGEVLNLTDKVEDGIVYFDIPEGFYRIFVLFTTQKNGGREFYMNLIDADSVKVLLDAVYEPHYSRYKAEFGNTFAGFFSDEAEIGNTSGYDFIGKLGKRDVKLPWSKALEKQLKTKWGESFTNYLPALWYEYGEKTSGIRTDFMDSVSALIQSCFTNQVGKWCRDRGVEYIGHIIEDDNAHGRLGCSIGHYFRYMKGQDMSGIDVVLLQIIPGFTETIHQWIASDRDGEFFHYGLAKLGSSAAHIDARKQGRALCEIYGAYGWAEGVSLMKWLTDHMLVRGINVFVPHAFSMQFPDRDCPPHFYAGGNNPQYRFFVLLMHYMNRLCHLLNGGIHLADAAVLYHADSEWSGGDTMLFQKPVRALMESQLDLDVIPADVFTEKNYKVVDGKLEVNGVTYGSLILPYMEYLPETVENLVITAAKEGLRIYLINELPEKTSHNNQIQDAFIESVTVIGLDAIAKQIRKTQKQKMIFSGKHPFLRASCYKQKDGEVYMFFNESPFKIVDTYVKFEDCTVSQLRRYDGLTNKIDSPSMKNGSLHLVLEPGQAEVFIKENVHSKPQATPSLKVVEEQTIHSDWRVSKSKASTYPVFEEVRTISKSEKLPNMNGREGFPRFTGTFSYEGKLNMEVVKDAKYSLKIPKVGDCAEIWVNDSYAGMVIGSPYRVDVTQLLKVGENKLKIEVTNTLVWQMHDGQSTHMQLAPTGMTQPPILEVWA